jgi:hypothetical protein
VLVPLWGRAHDVLRGHVHRYQGRDHLLGVDRVLDILFTPGWGLVGILIDGGTGGWFEMPSTVHLDFVDEVATQSTDKDPEGTKVARSEPKEPAEAVPASSSATRP